MPVNVLLSRFAFLASEIENDEDADPDYCPAIVDAQQG